MLPTTIHTAPAVQGDFMLLSEYQSTTPQSFHDGKPVLHYHATGAKAWLPKDQQSSVPIFPADAPAFEGDSGEMISQDEIELFINSENLTIFNTKTSTGIQIPYPSIGLHAMQHKADPAADGAADSDANKAPCVLLQLDLSDGGDDDETFDTIQLTLIPPPSSTDLSSPAQEGSAARSEQEKLFDAITACQNLHPDPADDDEDDDGEDYADRIVFESAVDGSSEAIEGLPGVFRGSATGDLPPPMPGSTTGWITAENVGEFFDADGNWIGGGDDEEKDGEDLGEGAGRVRARDELNGHENGADGEADSKRPRTE
ncbi:hypothetical protein N0V82_010609 [Gnomoniopsis sp. IMI 355080]|nr:hypothetical protein N0V82_010609 [Gnomoniopsis sp. IMI 355080]